MKYCRISTHNATAIAIERVKLENEGWERDQSVKEPVEPSSKKS
jgi:hypothetical protein